MKNEIIKLQEKMAEHGIDYYLVPTSDYHGSEMVSDFFKCREFLSGFTGSAGTLLVSKDQAWLWTDGRYYIQAAAQLEGSGIALMKDGSPGVPKIHAFLAKEMKENTTLGFDGRLYGTAYCNGLRRMLRGINRKMKINLDLVHEIWDACPAISCNPVFVFPEKYAGVSSADKLAAYRDYLKKNGAECQLLTGLMDIAWLFNLRGSDVECTPVFLSYAYVGLDRTVLFVQGSALSEDVRGYLTNLGVEIAEYDSFYSFIATLGGKRILMDQSDLNFYALQSLPKDATAIPGKKYTTNAKIVKNDVEIANTKACHIRDGVYMTKFMYWLKHEIRKRNLTEIEVSDYIDGLRLGDELSLGLSFETISGYGTNAAIVHYTATEKSNAVIRPEGMLLVDSGGQYYDGTTDITRTFIMGPVSEEEKTMYTTVLRSMLRLANTKFMAGCRGSNLDAIARQPMWDMGLDFLHGTGHGVGHVLSVHEGPNSFSFHSARPDAVLMPGMVTTDEPGLYFENKFGIRIENELLCKKWKQTSYGAFLQFEFLTYVPIDLDGVDLSLMNEEERGWLNQYHKDVYDKISPYLTVPEKEWLKIYTAAI